MTHEIPPHERKARNLGSHVVVALMIFLCVAVGNNLSRKKRNPPANVSQKIAAAPRALESSGISDDDWWKEFPFPIFVCRTEDRKVADINVAARDHVVGKAKEINEDWLEYFVEYSRLSLKRAADKALSEEPQQEIFWCYSKMQMASGKEMNAITGVFTPNDDGKTFLVLSFTLGPDGKAHPLP